MRQLQKLFTASFIAGVAAFGTGCTEAKTSVFIRHVIYPSFEDESCLFEADPSGTFLGDGSLDVAFASVYKAFFAVGNQLVQRGDSDTLKAESNRVQFYEVEVEVYDFAGGLLSEYTVPATGFADPGASNSPGYGVVSGIIVDASVTQAFRDGAIPANQTIVARTVVHGLTLGGLEVETAPYDFPIFVTNVGSCVEPASCDEDVEAETCYVGQDFVPDCRVAEARTNVESTNCF